MRERPILFSGPMVRAILEGKKTQTRRLADSDLAKASGCKHALEFFHQDGKWLYGDNDGLHPFASEPVCRHGQPGERLWVKETFFDAAPHKNAPQFAALLNPVIYRADYDYRDKDRSVIGCHNWKPSIFMPRTASRITLEITDLRSERLQEISEEDAISEGIFFDKHMDGWVSDSEGRSYHGGSAKRAYEKLWSAINGPDSWGENPWVWAIEIGRINP